MDEENQNQLYSVALSKSTLATWVALREQGRLDPRSLDQARVTILVEPCGHCCHYFLSMDFQSTTAKLPCVHLSLLLKSTAAFYLPQYMVMSQLRSWLQSLGESFFPLGISWAHSQESCIVLLISLKSARPVLRPFSSVYVIFSG